MRQYTIWRAAGEGSGNCVTSETSGHTPGDAFERFVESDSHDASPLTRAGEVYIVAPTESAGYGMHRQAGVYRVESELRPRLVVRPVDLTKGVTSC